MPSDPVQEFADALAKAGLVLTGPPLMDGRIHRAPVIGDSPGKTSGSYKAFLDHNPSGFIMNWKTGTQTPWRANLVRSARNADYFRHQKEVRDRAQAAEMARSTEKARVAISARAIFDGAPLVTQHQYLIKKNVKPHGLRLSTWRNANELLVPLRTIDGELCNLQRISPAGEKNYLRGGAVSGTFFAIDNLEHAEVIVIAEGYATAATIYEATGLPTVAACTATNLVPVAKALREHYPGAKFIIAGDNDHHLLSHRDHENRPLKNIGEKKAIEAAEAIGAVVAIPYFEPSAPGTDWNDYAAAYGLPEVKKNLLMVLSLLKQAAE